jgi:tRNA (adenine37-N6)-methyltransferase
MMRKCFLGAVAALTVAGGVLAGEETEPRPEFRLFPVGEVRKEGKSVRIEVFDAYADALLGLDGYSHVNVLYWMDKIDVPAKRRILRLHPRGNRQNPLTGVFACRTPLRPNPIALTVCKILKVDGNVITLDKIDAFDKSPVLDLKPFIPSDAPQEGVREPEWVKKMRERRKKGKK